MIDDLPEDLAALVSAERATRPSAEIYTSVKAKLAASAVVVCAATVSSTSAAAAGSSVVGGTGLATKLVVVLALAAGGTTAAVVLTHVMSSPTAPSPTAPRTSTSRAPSVSTTNASTPSEIPEPPPSAAPPSAAPAQPTSPALPESALSESREHVRRVDHTHARPSRTAAEPPPPVPAPESEARFVAKAWRTLATDPAAALVEIETITGSTLVEEREAIRCVALARLHRAEAADAITQFLSAHPRSVHRALVERAQKGLP